MKKNYSWQQVILHWISAVVIIWATVTGFYVGLFNVSDELKTLTSFINVSLTTLLIPVFIIRLYFYFTSERPEEINTNPFTRLIAHLVHFLLYLNITLVLVTGVLMMERDINVFDIFIIPQPIQDLSITGIFNTVHVFSCATLGTLIVLHIAAVVKHELSGKKVLRRMSL
ncbi:prokaryotic cytochrome b561 family protein [Yersinia ruckeri]|uniref:cytochrome b n=1 Tax=Yersinia ruckeri TaxID=29486 RepID=UPI0005ABD62E|nr:cytochrome b/b6 domain-containing protein [Yersinia ruckeri]AJI96148.1 prokaryotic cytochrome b561 family protein [Yersinia ruckeri]MCW6566919.1 cytochrome b/b6 domain-containing protein [Yersinia ruckeri]